MFEGLSSACAPPSGRAQGRRPLTGTVRRPGEDRLATLEDTRVAACEPCRLRWHCPASGALHCRERFFLRDSWVTEQVWARYRLPRSLLLSRHLPFLAGWPVAVQIHDPFADELAVVRVNDDFVACVLAAVYTSDGDAGSSVQGGLVVDHGNSGDEGGRPVE